MDLARAVSPSLPATWQKPVVTMELPQSGERYGVSLQSGHDGSPASPQRFASLDDALRGARRLSESHAAHGAFAVMQASAAEYAVAEMGFLESSDGTPMPVILDESQWGPIRFSAPHEDLRAIISVDGTRTFG